VRPRLTIGALASKGWAMRFSHIRLKNWRNFREVDVDLTQRVFLVGPNASGKSNFLDVFRFLRDVVKQGGGGLQSAVSARGGISKIRCLAARRSPEIEIEVSLSDRVDNAARDWRYLLSIKQEQRGHRRAFVNSERVWRADELILNRPDKDDAADSERLSQTALEQINANVEFRDVADFFNSVAYLHLIPQVIRHPEHFGLISAREGAFGQTFLERIAGTTPKTRDARLKRIEQVLKIAVPQFKELRITKDNRGIPHLETLYEHWRAKGARQSETEFSDGTLRLLALLWSLLEGEGPLLLEEPEMSLHDAFVARIAPLVYRLQKTAKKARRQVLISTHSAKLLSDKGIGGEEVLLLEPDTEGTIVKQASSIAEITSLLESGMSVAEAALPRTEPGNIVQLELPL